jgi:hypothetical protein
MVSSRVVLAFASLVLGCVRVEILRDDQTRFLGRSLPSKMESVCAEIRTLEN